MTTLNKLVLIATLALTGCNFHKLSNSDYAKTSAMITLENKTSGGSGVIMHSEPGLSTVLTNKHVCQLIQIGGVVTTDKGSYPVKSFQVYTKHDLCLIKVEADLHENNKLAEKAPKIYSEVIIAGHPALLPTIVSRGHFANPMPIQLMVGAKPCDGTEKGQEAMMCIFMGFKAIIATLDAQPVSALIMPGSSGSGVFNDIGEVSGLVFAGREGLSYGFIVPHSYLKDFLTNISSYPAQYPDAKAKPKDFFASFYKLQSVCSYKYKECKGISFQEIYLE